MNRKASEDEMPSIIQEIVFYDKPNIKAILPEEILPVSSAAPLAKGDIVFSRIRKSSLPHTSIGKDRDDDTKTDDQKSTTAVEKGSVAALKKYEQVDSKPFSSIDSLNHFISYENLEEASLEDVDVAQSPNEPRALSTVKTYSSKSVKRIVEVTKIDKNYSQSDKTTGEPLQAATKASKLIKQSKRSNDRESTIKEENLKSKKGKEVSTAGEISVKITKEAPPVSSKESPFKKPKRPVKKPEKKTQKVTMLNYVTKKSKDGPLDQKPVVSKAMEGKSTKEKPAEKVTTVEVATKEKIPLRTGRKSDRVLKPQEKAGKAKERSSTNLDSAKGMKNTEQRSSGRAKRTSESHKKAVKMEDYYSDEDVSFRSPEKNKNYTVLTNVRLDNDEDSTDNVHTEDLEELLDEASEHVKALNRVEEDLQNLFEDGKEGERNQNTKGKRKVPERKSKSSAVLVKRVKKEVDEDDEDSSRDPLDASAEDDYDTDGDSRGEWLPLEYAEYKQQHVMRHQNKTFPCKYCGQQFPSYYSMRKHRALAHDDLGKDRKEGTYKESLKCKQEKERDDSDEESRDEWMPQDYADYKMKHKMNKMKRAQWYKCKICCAVFSNYYKLSKHRVEHENKPNPYECKQCDGRFKNVETLMAHIRVHQGKDPYQCRKCEKGFMTKEELEEHIPVHILKKGPTPLKRFRCDICSKEFSKLCDIERHTRVHTGEKPSECNICHKRFQQSHNLSKHLLTHLHVRPFQCEICNKKFGRIDVLNRHLLTHSMEKPFKCQICDKGFIRHVQLTNHVEKSHTSSDRGLVVANEASGNFEEGEEDESNEEGDEEVEEVVGI